MVRLRFTGVPSFNLSLSDPEDFCLLLPPKATRFITDCLVMASSRTICENMVSTAGKLTESIAETSLRKLQKMILCGNNRK